MIQDREIDWYSKSNPDKTNADPWDASRIIKCSELVEKYRECIASQSDQGTLTLLGKCTRLKKLAAECYILQPKYFIESAKDVLDEEYYLDMYINKQLHTSRKPKAFNMKNHNI